MKKYSKKTNSETTDKYNAPKIVIWGKDFNNKNEEAVALNPGDFSASRMTLALSGNFYESPNDLTPDEAVKHMDNLSKKLHG